ncbi:MAG: TonB-dependent receptor SusC [Flavobacterium sp. SCGC AAA160-P02]|nr:MAG: TonB-dependent receptor SusC [Flavobacterium sp. SCGC AAA160-P02]
MKTKFKVVLTLILALIVQVSFAQEKTVSGTVSDNSGSLPGVSVTIKGTTSGAETDFDGKYSIKASTGDVLVFSYLGYKTVENTVGSSNVIDVTLVEGGEILDEIIVTAQGIKREKKALGYAVSEVKSEQLEQRSEGDIGRILTGKASGVNIQTQSGVSGSGTSILIRGMSSFSGSNQPLFVVDGVPFSSDTNAQGNFVNGNNGSSRFLDIDPNNIESVNVLKGLAAATLYGTQGRNGVILITTKSGSSRRSASKQEITVSSSVFFNEIASLANYQNEYGNGFDQAFGWFFSNWGPSFSRDGPAGWGGQAAIDANGTLEHPYSTASPTTGIPQAFPEFAGARYDWRPYNSVPDFFRTGVVRSNNINIRSSSEDGKINYNVNYGSLDDEGFTPGNSVGRNTLSVGGNAKLSNKFTVSGTMNYARTNFKSPPVAASYGSNVGGQNASIFGNIFYTPRSVDLMGLPFQNPITGESVYYRQNNSIQHPLWTVANAGNTQLTNRVFGNAAITYALNDNINVMYQFGFDTYSENNSNYSNRGGKTGSVANQSGQYETWNNTNTINNHKVSIAGNYDLSDDFDLNFTVGAESRRDVYDRSGVSSTGQQVFGVLRHFNFAVQDEIQVYQERNIVGLFGQADLGYKDMAYLTVAARKDWVSNLTQENRSITYPSASISFLPSKAFDFIKESDAIGFLKVRAGYGTSASFPTGYPVASTLTLNTQDFNTDGGVDIVTNTTSSFLGNPDLKPERMDELEFGLEGSFLDNRVSLDLSVYKRITKDLIVDRPLDAASGFDSTQTNIGKIENNGIEIDLTTDLFRNDGDGFNWTTNFNWSTSEAIVKDLGLDTDIVVFAGFTNRGNAAIEGESLGTMIGSAIARDDNGNFRVNGAGSYVIQTGNNIIGDANPDFTFNIANQISYKNFSLGFLFNWIQGGDMYAQTIQTLLGRGVVNQEGIDRANSFILPGVNPAGQPNNMQINNSTYYFSNVLYGPDEMGVYDATVFRLQELSLGYSLPENMLSKTPFGSLSVTLSANNLWYYTPNMPKNTNFDPNVAGLGVGNGRGFEYLNGPSSRRYGVSVKASF